MYNLAISLGIAALAFAVGAFAAGWLAGFVPALIAALAAYFLLARRTGKQLEGLMAQAGDAIQKGQIDQARKLMEQGFALGKWQFLINEQLHSQLGALDYLQRNFGSAREHLEKSWSRNWMSMAMLSCLDHREGHDDDALQRMEKTTGPGGNDPTFWALYAWLAVQAKDEDKALSVVTRGLQKNAGSEGLKALEDALRNKKRIKPEKQFAAFAPAWYQFFPEHMPRSQMMALAAQQQGGQPGQPAGPRPGGYQYPAPKGFRR